jgi:PKD repeat protein
MYGGSQALTRSRDAETGNWSVASSISTFPFAGGPVLHRDSDYNMVAVIMAGNAGDFSRFGDGVIDGASIYATYRADGDSGFGDARAIYTGPVNVFAGGALVADGDMAGNSVVAIPVADDGGNRHLAIAIGDGSSPELGSVSVPASGTVGVPVAFSASPFDLWSSVASTDWAFGDGSRKSGASVVHTYRTPGVKTVEVTATDLNGFESSSDHRITIAPASVAPPADDDGGEDPTDDEEDAPPPPRKKIAAPIIEARLTGRTITLNARISVRKGKRCSGKAKATTRFGNRTYRTTLRLKTSSRTCRATGKIKLKKTPSARTKLRIKISSSSTKTRTLSTKRS